MVLAAAACAVTEGVTPPDASFDGSSRNDGTDASAGSDAQDAGAALSTFRIAHLAADVGPVDICYRRSSSEAFTGPLLAALMVKPADAGAALDAGLEGGIVDAAAPAVGIGFRSVTGFFSVPSAATLEIAVVGAGDGSCSTPRARSRITLDAGKRVTVALLGLGQADAGSVNELALLPFVDDATPQASSARTRFIHAALGTSLSQASAAFSVSALAGAATTGLAADVEPRKASSPAGAPPVVDALGYHSSAAVGSASILLTSLGDGGTPAWGSSARELQMSLGSVHTGFIVSESMSGLSVVWCDDTSARMVGVGSFLTNCVPLRP